MEGRLCFIEIFHSAKFSYFCPDCVLCVRLVYYIQREDAECD
ncbi:hypothetical protein HMPREF9163_01144 [Selenomonas sp. oral taxon 138 str. F0429]|nr:hypothetical protein HMPREF9163_01144 [Selenomonas sp. oral taxon 138 str. F0429]